MKQFCIACTNLNLIPKYLGVEDYEYGTYHPVDFYICNNCGLLVQHPKPEDKDISSFYPSEYRNHFMQENGMFYSKLKQFQLWWFAKKLEFIILGGGKNKKKNILEIGCGSGELLLTLKKRGFNYLYGNDILDTAKKTLLKNGIRFQKGDVVEKFPYSEKFDIIILNHVFEHLLDPVKVLKLCKEHLNQNGKIIIVMPNANSTAANIFKEKWNGLSAPRHIYIFSPESMKMLRKKINLKKLRLFTMPDPLSWSLSFQNVLQSFPLFKTKLKNGLAWYTIPFGLLFAPFAILSKIGKKTAGMMYVFEI